MRRKPAMRRGRGLALHRRGLAVHGDSVDVDGIDDRGGCQQEQGNAVQRPHHQMYVSRRWRATAQALDGVPRSAEQGKTDPARGAGLLRAFGGYLSRWLHKYDT